MRLRLNLQWKVLLLVAATMFAILAASAYLHGVTTKSLSGEYRYNNAIRQVVTIAKRTETNRYFDTPADVLQEIQFLLNSRPDFKQIDVFQTAPDGERLVASTSPEGPRLPYLKNSSPLFQYRTRLFRPAVSPRCCCVTELGYA